MFLSCFRICQNIINKTIYSIHILQQFACHFVVGGSGIYETKWHSLELKVAIWSTEGCILLVFRIHRNLPVSFATIHFTEIVALCYFGKYNLGVRHNFTIKECNFIDFPHLCHSSVRVVFLLQHDYWRAVWTVSCFYHI